MFKLVFNELKNYNSNLKIGGPGLAGKSKKEYQEDLLNYFKNNNIDIDFFSWHSYGSKIENNSLIQSPDIVKERIEEIKEDLESYGFENLQTYCTEWNADIQDHNFSTTSRGAAFFAGVLKIFLDYSVTESYFFRGDNLTVLGSFDENGKLKKCFYTLKAFDYLKSTTRINTTNLDDNNIYIISTKDNDNIWILIGNYNENEYTLKVKIQNTEDKKNSIVWEINDIKNLDNIGSINNMEYNNNELICYINLYSYSVKLIKIY